MMNLLNATLTRSFDLLLLPFRSHEPIWGLVAASVLTGVAMLLLFRVTSDQRGIKKIRDTIRAHVLEIRLFKDDLRIMFRAQGRIVRYSFVYMRYALKPLLFIFPVVLLIMIQLDLRYGRRPLEPGETTVVTARLPDGAGIPEIGLSASEGLAIETPPVRAASRGEVSWRIRALEKGRQTVTLEVEGTSVDMAVLVGSDRVVPVEPVRGGRGFWQRLTHPGEPPLSRDAPVTAIEVRYRSTTVPIFGIGLHWLIHFCVFSIVAGFALKNAFGVEL